LTFQYNDDIYIQWKAREDETTPDRPDLKTGWMTRLVRLPLIHFATSAPFGNGSVREDEGAHFAETNVCM
jgi:hypothetical protein